MADCLHTKAREKTQLYFTNEVEFLYQLICKHILNFLKIVE
nr:MAG TPA: hypothetical protein [Caudoviricetes sp.]